MKRYAHICTNMEECECGDYVKWDDVIDIEIELRYLKATAKTLYNIIGSHFEQIEELHTQILQLKWGQNEKI